MVVGYRFLLGRGSQSFDSILDARCTWREAGWLTADLNVFTMRLTI